MKLAVTVLMLAIITVTSAADTTAPVIGPPDQQKLAAAFIKLKQAEAVVATASSEWRATMFEAMANAGCSPQKYDMQLKGEQFVCTERPKPSPTPNTTKE